MLFYAHWAKLLNLGQNYKGGNLKYNVIKPKLTKKRLLLICVREMKLKHLSLQLVHIQKYIGT